MSSGLIVTRTPDGLSAYLLVSNQREAAYPTREEILGELTAHGITFGLNVFAIEGMVTERLVNKKVEVATGTKPEAGEAGRIEMAVDLSSIGKPRRLPDGRVDYHDICYVVNVKKGDVLARRIPPVPGKEGRTVLDKPLPAPPPKDARLMPGPGTRISPTDTDVLVADLDGGIYVEREGTVVVRKETKITGDIDYQTGNINFAGDLTITGSIRAGFSVESKGLLVIGGSVEDCKIRCMGNLVIKGGAVGSGTGSIDCKGSVRVRHLENFAVVSGGEMTVAEDIVNGTVSCGGIVRAKSVRGGVVASTVAVEAESIGSSGEIKTVIDIGKKYERIQLRYKLMAKVASLTTEIENHKERVFRHVRDNLDDSGALSAEHERTLGVMKLKMKELLKNLAMTQAEIETLDNLKIEGADPYVQATVIFPNTVVRFGVGEQTVREQLERVRLAPVEKGTSIALAQETA